MKASIKFRDDQKPLLRAKIPLNVLNLPFQSGILAGESKELSLNLSTYFESGPALKFFYRPNDSQNPFSFVFKTGIGHFGSPTKSPFTMSAEFNLVGGHQNPRFFINFKPNFGDFSLKKSHSSDLLRDKLNGDSFANHVYFKGNGFFPAADDSKTAAGQMISGLLRGSELSAVTALPLLDVAVVNFRWGLRVPPQCAAVEEVDTVIVGKRRDGLAGFRIPHLVMNKIGIEHVAQKAKKVSTGGKRDEVADACIEVKKKLEVIQAENSLLGKALSDLRSDIASGKLNFMMEHHNKYSSGDQRGNGAMEGKGYRGKAILEEGNEELKV